MPKINEKVKFPGEQSILNHLYSENGQVILSEPDIGHNEFCIQYIQISELKLKILSSKLKNKSRKARKDLGSIRGLKETYFKENESRKQNVCRVFHRCLEIGTALISDFESLPGEYRKTLRRQKYPSSQ